MAWIESHQELRDHPKTKRAMRLLGISLPEVIGHLHLLWWWTLQYYLDGRLANVTMAEIEDAAMWQGEAGALVTALVAAGFLEEDGDAWLVHDWYEYAEKYIDRRAANAQRMREARAAKEKPRATHVQRTSRARAGATIPNQTIPNQTIPNQENPPVANATSPRKRGGAREEPADGFTKFYAEYPRHDDRQEAIKAWNKLTDVQRRLACDALPAWLACEQWQTPRFVPMAATFLNQHRFENAPVAASVSATNGRASPNGQYLTAQEKTQHAIGRYAERIKRNGTTQDDERSPVVRAHLADRVVPLDDG